MDLGSIFNCLLLISFIIIMVIFIISIFVVTYYIIIDERETKKMTFKECIKKLDSINDRDNLMYDDCKWHSYDNLEWYELILKEVLKDKPERVIDIGSNLNQYGFLFENEGIEYIGIDKNTTVPTKYGIMQPIITEKIKYVQCDYNKVKDYFKDDIIISCLCVGYEVPLENVKYKKLIINDLDEDGNPIIKIYERGE